MLAGHYSAAFLAKAAAPRTPLWLLALAVQLVDVLWACLVLAGIERLSLDPNLPSNPLVLDFMPYTHSAAGTLLWAGLAGLATWRWLGSRAAAWAVGAAVASHWLLDFLVHRPDMTLWGTPPRLGLALWNHPGPALALELGLLVGSAVFCFRVGALPARSLRTVSLVIAALAALQLVTTLAPPAVGATGVALSGLATFVLVPFALRRVD